MPARRLVRAGIGGWLRPAVLGSGRSNPESGYECLKLAQSKVGLIEPVELVGFASSDEALQQSELGSRAIVTSVWDACQGTERVQFYRMDGTALAGLRLRWYQHASDS